MFHKVCRVDFSLCQKLEMIVWFVKILKKPSNFFLVTKNFTYSITKAIFSFPKCHTLQGNSFLSFGLARTPRGFDWLFFQTKLPWDPHSPEPPTSWGLVLLIRFFFSSLMSARNARGPTHPRVGLQSLFPHCLSLWNCFSLQSPRIQHHGFLFRSPQSLST